MEFDDPYDPPPGLESPSLAAWNLARFGAHDRSSHALLRQVAAEGADLSVCNRFGINPLILAIKFDAPGQPMTRLLLELGAPLGAQQGFGSAIAFASRLLDSGAASRLLSDEAARRAASDERNALNEGLPPAPHKSAPRV